MNIIQISKYLLPYILFSISVSLLLSGIDYISNKKILFCKYDIKKIFFYFLSFILIFIILYFSAFRVIGAPNGAMFVKKGIYVYKNQLLIYPGGADSSVYKKIFESCKNISLIDALKSFNGIEIGYIFVSWFFANLLGSYEIFLTINYFLMSYALLVFSRFTENKNGFLSYFLFYVCILTIFIPSFNTFRNNFVVIMSIFIIREFIYGKNKSLILLIFCLMMIHVSAIVWMLPIVVRFFVKRFNNKKKILILLIIIISSFSIILKYFLSFIPRYRHYADAGGSISFFWLITTLLIITEVVLMRNSFLCNEVNKNLFIIFLSFFPIFIYQLNFFIFYRFMIYSRLVGYILLHRLTNFKAKGSIKQLFNCLNLIIMILVIIGFLTEVYWCGLPYLNQLR